jgi:hypothetical protein
MLKINTEVHSLDYWNNGKVVEIKNNILVVEITNDYGRSWVDVQPNEYEVKDNIVWLTAAKYQC